MSIEIYGASDDLIEIEGDVREEFNCNYDEGTYVATNCGAVQISYTHSGEWRINAIEGVVTIAPCPVGNEDNYSDRATIHGNIKWVVAGKHFAPAKYLN